MTLVDDFDGSPAEQTASFAVDGKQYEIDLNAEHLKEFFTVLDSYAEVGRLVGKSRPSRSGRSKKGSANGTTSPGGTMYNPDEVRAWAKANGHEVSDRGRIRFEVIEAWRATHP